ncbi:hypothetical protein [Vibrio cyclitrophicus]|uniref:hypothetical protein n=1 Tax=Vibrio cyclitrophicus TaxID=47951 RepID=UPI000C82E779|nr:hypothetical protein [Vibrio cyclitrophicus]PMH51508.1 hypothetical protein BCU65_20765 [Vibrio cyclitrophicus]
MSDFTAIGQLVTEARNLLDSIKGGAIRTMQTQFDTLKQSFQLVVVNSQQTFDSFVNAQRGRVDAVLTHFDKSTSYVHAYHSSYPYGFSENQSSGEYHVVQLKRIKNKLTSLNPLISLAFHGGSNVGAAVFISLAQSHASYTGQKALIYKQGNPDIKFFIDRTNESDAPVYVAVRNTSANSASVEVKASSNAALDFEFHSVVKQIPSEWEEIQKVNT